MVSSDEKWEWAQYTSNSYVNVKVMTEMFTVIQSEGKSLKIQKLKFGSMRSQGNLFS